LELNIKIKPLTVKFYNKTTLTNLIIILILLTFSKLNKLQWQFEYRTSSVFQWSFCVLMSNGLIFEWHRKTEHIQWLSEYRTSLVFRLAICVLSWKSPVFKCLSKTGQIGAVFERSNGLLSFISCPVFEWSKTI
jgi:hypothetical protein